MKHAAVRVTRRFVENLDAIEAFLHEANAEPEIEALLDDLFKEVIPALERFPDLGSDFFRRRPSSREAADLAATLRARLGSGTTLRERVRGDYLLLYSRRDHELHLLAIKHHLQLSFDFSEFWEF